MAAQIDTLTRVCSRCETEKPLEAFHRSAKDPLGRQYMCAECQGDARRERREADPEYYKGLQRKSRYGVSYEVYEQMLADQDGVCAICHGDETATANGTIRSLSVDHSHEDGTVRGLLCQKCNAAIGMFEDDIDRLTQAISYLKNTKDR